MQRQSFTNTIQTHLNWIARRCPQMGHALCSRNVSALSSTRTEAEARLAGGRSLDIQPANPRQMYLNHRTFILFIKIGKKINLENI